MDFHDISACDPQDSFIVYDMSLHCAAERSVKLQKCGHIFVSKNWLNLPKKAQQCAVCWIQCLSTSTIVGTGLLPDLGWLCVFYLTCSTW